MVGFIPGSATRQFQVRSWGDARDGCIFWGWREHCARPPHRLLLQLFCGRRTATRTPASRRAAEIYRHADDHAFDRPIADLTRRYTLKRKSRTSPSFTTYSLPSLRMTPASRAAASRSEERRVGKGGAA